MRRNLARIGITALVMAGAFGATALAARKIVPAMAAAHHGGHGEMMKQHVEAFIDDALDAANATPAQRQQIKAAGDQAFATLKETHGDRRADLQQAVTIFEADPLDNAKIAELRAKHMADAKTSGDAIVQAVTAAHDALTPAQRKIVADYIRTRKPGRHGAGLRVEMMKRFATTRLDAALDAAGVSASQRPQIDAARDQLFSTMEEMHPAGALAAHLDKALAVFEADKIDPAAVAALRAEHEQKMQKAGDAIVQAIHDVHDALTAPQRKALVEYVKAQRAKWHHGPMGAGGPMEHGGPVE